MPEFRASAIEGMVANSAAIKFGVAQEARIERTPIPWRVIILQEITEIGRE